jgi:hypothetical protein
VLVEKTRMKLKLHFNGLHLNFFCLELKFLRGCDITIEELQLLLMTYLIATYELILAQDLYICYECICFSTITTYKFTCGAGLISFDGDLF